MRLESLTVSRPLRSVVWDVEGTRLEIPGRGATADELANAVTHGLGLALSVIGCDLLLARVCQQGTVGQAVGCGVFGAALVTLYAASTFYHGARHSALKAA